MKNAMLLGLVFMMAVMMGVPGVFAQQGPQPTTGWFCPWMSKDVTTAQGGWHCPMMRNAGTAGQGGWYCPRMGNMASGHRMMGPRCIMYPGNQPAPTTSN